MWVRGLKHQYLDIKETDIMSHPMWVRGLKLAHFGVKPKHDESHPMWVRGLKPMLLYINISVPRVAPHVGAWIETLCWRWDSMARRRRTPCGCVD